MLSAPVVLPRLLQSLQSYLDEMAVSELFLTDNAWYKMWWFVFMFHKEQVSCGGAISEVVTWLCVQHSPSKQSTAFWDKI